MRIRPVVFIPALVLLTSCASSSSGRQPAASTTPGPTLGKFVWHDLSTDDVPAAQRFYAALLGWEFRETTRNGRRVGARLPLSKSSHPRS